MIYPWINQLGTFLATCIQQHTGLLVAQREIFQGGEGGRWASPHKEAICPHEKDKLVVKSPRNKAKSLKFWGKQAFLHLPKLWFRKPQSAGNVLWQDGVKSLCLSSVKHCGTNQGGEGEFGNFRTARTKLYTGSGKAYREKCRIISTEQSLGSAVTSAKATIGGETQILGLKCNRP